MKKVLMIIGSIFLAFVLLLIIIVVIVSVTSKKLTCKSSEGNITITYNDKTITGYTSVGMTYDMDAQKAIADEIGIEEYLDQFSTWFSTNTSGSCEN